MTSRDAPRVCGDVSRVCPAPTGKCRRSWSARWRSRGLRGCRRSRLRRTRTPRRWAASDHSCGKRRTMGTITASRPPGRSTRAISDSAAVGSGISCRTAIETTASTVWSRSGSRWASARRKPTCGPASARTARASIGSEMSTPKASPSGPAARASDGVTEPGPEPTSNAMPPGGMFNHSTGCCHMESNLRLMACALS